MALGEREDGRQIRFGVVVRSAILIGSLDFDRPSLTMNRTIFSFQRPSLTPALSRWARDSRQLVWNGEH
jgi:hypothetical protein